MSGQFCIFAILPLIIESCYTDKCKIEPTLWYFVDGPQKKDIILIEDYLSFSSSGNRGVLLGNSSLSLIKDSWLCQNLENADLGSFKSRRHHSSDWDKELCRHVAAVCGNVRHCCCCCSLLIIGSICRLSQLRLSRGLLQPIKCALSAPATPAARIIRPNYSSYSRPALFTGVGALINRSGSNTPPKQLSSDVDPFSTIR